MSPFFPRETNNKSDDYNGYEFYTETGVPLNPLTTDWQRELAEAFSSVDLLCHHLQIDPTTLPLLSEYKAFPLRVPRGFVDCMQKGNPQDPLLRQILPLQDELIEFPGYSLDPVGDLPATTQAGVIHKYHGRVLLIVTGGCAVHCRYCFRRNFPYADQQLSSQKMEQALAYIEQHHEISEVILSGGDPLLLNDSKLKTLLQRIANIPSIERIRIHSRIPIVLPSRTTPELLDTLESLRPNIVLVLHANHANELSEPVAAACQALKQRGITLLNQSVLLKGVNDEAESLIKLSEKLFAQGVLPYYLHQLDRAQGVGHFEVNKTQALSLLSMLQRRLPGYLVPKLVQEQAGAAHKILLTP
jgi:EF-P beta-lysylation protein EpmB